MPQRLQLLELLHLRTFVGIHGLSSAGTETEIDRQPYRKPQIISHTPAGSTQAFVEGFVEKWLHVSRIRTLQLNRQLFPRVDESFADTMIGESRAFFRKILADDLSILNFIDGKSTALNAHLAHHYEITWGSSSELKWGQIPVESPRGGLLGQAAFLTATSHDNASSPVRRGAFILENFLGQQPGNPLPECRWTPNAQGKPDIREQLAKNRAEQRCATCHSQIDPLGLALENFDASGKWRSHYKVLAKSGENENEAAVPETGDQIDVAVVLTDGEKIDGPNSLRHYLLEHHKVSFARALTEKLLTEAVAHPLDKEDQASINAIMAKAKEKNCDIGLQTLIMHIVQCPAFFR